MCAVVPGVGDVKVTGDVVDGIEFIAVGAAEIDEVHVAVEDAGGDLDAVPGGGALAACAAVSEAEERAGVVLSGPAGCHDFAVDEQRCGGTAGFNVDINVIEIVYGGIDFNIEPSAILRQV